VEASENAQWQKYHTAMSRPAALLTVPIDDAGCGQYASSREIQKWRSRKVRAASPPESCWLYLQKLGQMAGNCESPKLSRQLFNTRRTGYMDSLCER
jgi:hypothetical protein